uniref:Uridylate-specific endoribonuclease n=1 Tax=Gasterosteus aculeatus aculeatus TaxID=481459 RepID=A0AAQ4Q405_GASAC
MLAVNQELSDIFNELWRLDKNRLTPVTDYNISGRASFVNPGSHVVRDYALQPLFSDVNENKLANTTTYGPQASLSTAEERTEIDLFLDAVLETEVMKRAHRYLVSKAKSNSDLRRFKSQLYLIWFNFYHRQRNAGLDSCGFEHVFVGETRSGRKKAHTWTTKDTRAGTLTYPIKMTTWRSSPSSSSGAWNGAVLVNIDQYQMELVVIRHGRSLGTAYPKLLSSNSRHVGQQHSR